MLLQRRKMMKAINLDGLPEPVAEAIEHLVEVLREQFRLARKTPGRADLPIWEGKVTGKLTREEIYEDVGRMGLDDASKE